jgi:DNA-binding transcriptional LysR family regulator
VHGTLARHFLLPNLPAFLTLYPEVEILMSERDRLVDLVREGIDCVLRVGTPQDSDMVGGLSPCSKSLPWPRRLISPCTERPRTPTRSTDIA